MCEPTSLLLGLEGLGVRAVTYGADRARVVEVITVDPDASRCPDSGLSRILCMESVSVVQFRLVVRGG